MSSDLRYLIFLNIFLIGISAYAAFISYRKSETNPKWYDATAIEEVVSRGNVEELTKLTTTLSAGLENRIAAVRSDRKRVALLAGFTVVVACSNLWLIIWLYRKSRKGLYLQDGVMLESE